MAGIIEYMNIQGFDVLDMSRIIRILEVTGGKIVKIVDNPKREILRP